MKKLKECNKMNGVAKIHTKLQAPASMILGVGLREWAPPTLSLDP